MNEQRLVEADRIEKALHYRNHIESVHGSNYGYVIGYTDCLNDLGLLEKEKDPVSGNSDGSNT